MASRNARLTFIGIAVVCVCVAWLVSMLFGPSSGPETPRGTGSLVERISNPLEEPQRATREQAALGQRVEPESKPIEAAPEPSHAADPLSPESLKLAIQSTVAGQIDPGGFLDAALALSKLEVQKQPIPLPNAFGAMRYPILGTPDGVTAELWVQATDGNSELGDPRLTYHVKLKASEGDVFEGVSRRDPDVQIELLTDKQGEFRRFSVLTDNAVSSKSKFAGVGMEGRTITTGVLFQYEPARPQEWIAQNCGLHNGVPFDADDRPTLVQGQWPRTEDLKLLKSSQMKQYGGL